MTQADAQDRRIEALQVQVAALQALVRGLLAREGPTGPMLDNSFAPLEMKDLGDTSHLSFMEREGLLQAAKEHALAQWHKGRKA